MTRLRKVMLEGLQSRNYSRDTTGCHLHEVGFTSVQDRNQRRSRSI